MARDADYLLDENYLFGQNMTEHNPAPSPSGHPLLSGPPTLTDIHQIFTTPRSKVDRRVLLFQSASIWPPYERALPGCLRTRAKGWAARLP
eukprot:scaffold45748_cov95-Phaeocystis_antarctica.AAC.1